MSEPENEVAGLAPKLRVWLTANEAELAPYREHRPRSLEDQVAHETRLVALLHDVGWSLRGWSPEVGGAGGTAISRAVLYDELAAAGLVIPEVYVLLETLGPVLEHYAPALAREHLDDMLAGRTIWAQGFSEPGAGSDLAALSCKAVAAGAGYLLDGQKTWTTLGHLADWALILARTGEPGHRGLTALWVDLHAPGVTLRPILAANGRNEFAEMFFDRVEVPECHIIGEVGGGWALAMYLLQFERGMYAWLRQCVLHARLNRLLGEPAGVPDRLAGELGETYALLGALREKSWRTVCALAAGESPGPEISTDKILLSRTEQAVHDLVRAVDPGIFLFGTGPEAALRRQEWGYSRATSVFGGAVDVQRDIVADRVLALPRGPRA